MKRNLICGLFLILPSISSCQFYIPEVDGIRAKGNFIYGHELCLRNDMNLPVPETKEKNAELTNFLDENNIVRAWIGGNDMGEEGKYRWINNGQRITMYFWQRNQPDNWQANEHCLEVKKVEKKWFWNDLGCNTKFIIVCEPKFDLDIRGKWDISQTVQIKEKA